MQGNQQLNTVPEIKQKQVAVPEIISVTSGKGGVGKSSVSVNLAILMQQLRKKVLVLDADIHLGNVDLICGVRSRYTIADVVTKNIPLNEVIVKGPGGIDILPASSAVSELIEMEDVILRKLASAFAGLQRAYDTIIVDTGAGIASTVLSFVLGSDKVILLVTPDPASIADAYAVIKVIKHWRVALPVVMVPNRVKTEAEGESIYKKMNLMVQKFLSSFIDYGGSIVEDEHLSRSVKLQQPLVLGAPNAPVVRTLKLLNRKLMGIPINQEHAKSSFFDRFIANRRLNAEELV